MRRTLSLYEIIRPMERDDLLPAIIFRSSRSQCDEDVRFAAKRKSLSISKEKNSELRKTIEQICHKYEIDRELISNHPQYESLCNTAIGAHHAGQLLVWRIVLEELMSRGLLKVLVATGTIAAGVDFPARSVVITAHTVRGIDGFKNLESRSFQQMSGRAGRRGKDSVGFCLAVRSRFCDPEEILKIAQSPPEPLKSSYFPSPNTVLNLLKYRNADDLRYTVSRNLAAWMDRREAESLRKEAAEIDTKVIDLDEKDIPKEVKRLQKKSRRLNKRADELESKQEVLLDKALSGLSAMGYIEGQSLSKKGSWAAEINTGLVLELSEIIEEKLLQDPTVERLVTVIASIAGDGHRKYIKPSSPTLSKDDEEKILKIINKIRLCDIPGLYEEIAVLQSAANTALTWMHCESWKEFRALLFLHGVQEGDAARLISQTAEHLNQLSKLFKTHHQIAQKAEIAKNQLLRPPLTEVMAID